jgi:CysZ protein
MIGDFLKGASYVFRGTGLVAKPELRRFVLIPLIINILVFTAAIWFGISQFDSLLDWMLPGGDSWWAEYARAALWVLFTVIVLLILFFTFTLLANLIGAPFNGLLSEKVEIYLSGEGLDSEGDIRDFLSTVLPSIMSEVKKILYYISIAAGIFLLLLIPGLNILSPILWAAYTSWMFTTEYTAYPMENHRMYFSQIRRKLKSHKALSFGFGLAVMIMSAIPFINFFVMPVAVSGATALWAERLKEG